MGLLPRGLKHNDILTVILILLLVLTLVHHFADFEPKQTKIVLLESNPRHERIPFHKGPYSKSPYNDVIPETTNTTQKTPLCIITTWDEKRFPDYGYLSLESITRNGADMVKLFVFYHYTTDNLPDPANYPNVEFINLAKLDDDYIFDGFAAFYGNQMCSIMELEEDSKECRFLKGSIQYGALRESGDPIHWPMRAYYGRLFEQWVAPSLCEGWTWGELDTLYGNMKTWLKGNRLVWSQDVFTLAGMDWKSLHPRKSLTVHVQARDPKKVNNIWKHSSKLKDYEFIGNALVRGKPWVMEEHYTEAIIASRVNYGILPWLGEPRGHRKVDYATVFQNGLWMVSGCDTEPSCREKLSLALHKRHSIAADNEYGARYYSMTTRLERDPRKCPHQNKNGKCIEASLLLPNSVNEGESLFMIKLVQGQPELFVWKKNPRERFKRSVDEVMLFDLEMWGENVQLKSKKYVELSAYRYN